MIITLIEITYMVLMFVIFAKIGKLIFKEVT